jgi:hypothetical protein
MWAIGSIKEDYLGYASASIPCIYLRDANKHDSAVFRIRFFEYAKRTSKEAGKTLATLVGSDRIPLGEDRRIHWARGILMSFRAKRNIPDKLQRRRQAGVLVTAAVLYLVLLLPVGLTPTPCCPDPAHEKYPSKGPCHLDLLTTARLRTQVDVKINWIPVEC